MMQRKIALLLASLAALCLPGMALASDEGGHKPELLGPDVATAIWVIIIFVVMLIILYPTAWKQVLAGLKAREERIRKDIADAEATRAKAEATLREYNERLEKAQVEVRAVLSKAAGDAERLAAQIHTRAQQEAEEARERATRDIEAARKHAIASIYEEAAEISTRIAEKIIRRNLNTDDQRALVHASLDELQATKS